MSEADKFQEEMIQIGKVVRSSKLDLLQQKENIWHSGDDKDVLYSEESPVEMKSFKSPQEKRRAHIENLRLRHENLRKGLRHG